MTTKLITGNVTCTSIFSNFTDYRTVLYTNRNGAGNLAAMTIGSTGVFIGASSGNATAYSNATSRLTMLGNAIGSAITTASDEVIIGYNAANALTSGNNSVIIGSGANYTSTTTSNAVCIGYNAGYKNIGNDMICIGYNAGTSSSSSVVATNGLISIGSQSTTSGAYTVGVGMLSNAYGLYGVALGMQAAAAEQGIAIGYLSSASGSLDSVAIGTSSQASASRAISIGSGVTNSTANRIAIGSSSDHLYVAGYFRAPSTTGVALKQDTQYQPWATYYYDHPDRTGTSGPAYGPTIVYQPGSNVTSGAVTAVVDQASFAGAGIMWVETIVVGKRTGGASGSASDCAGFRLMGMFYWDGVAANCVAVGTPVKEYSPASTTWDVNFSPSTTLVRVNVTGITNVNILWHSHTRYHIMT